MFSYIELQVVTAENAEVIGETTDRKSEELEPEVWEKANELSGPGDMKSLASKVKAMLGSQLKDALSELNLTTSATSVSEK